MKTLITLLISYFSFLTIYSQNVGIGTTSPTHATLEINGSVGAAVAMFGADKNGVTIQADDPEIGFNYFYNGGAKTIKAGFGSLIGMAPGSGELYIANFNGNQSITDFGNITGLRQNFTLKQSGEFDLLGSVYYTHFFFGANEDTYIRGGKNNSNVLINDVNGGKVGIGMGTPTRAALEQNGAVGNTAAIFGGEGAGISLQRNWPAIGFNHWYDGAVHRSISSGWVGQLGLSQSDGSLYFATPGDYNSTEANQDMGGVSTKFAISRFGNVVTYGNITIDGVTDGAALKIHNTTYNASNINYSGIRFETDASGGGYYPWNIYGSSSFYFAYNGAWKSYISSSDGSYYNVSDARMKKNIDPIQDNTLLKIMILNPVNYLMKEEADNSKKHIGFISQEVEKIFPEVVQETNGIKTMNYSGLIPILTKGIQEQQQQIEILQKENTDLKARLERLEKIILIN